MRVAVIGQGYVGLTLAFEAASVGHEVIGFDTNKDVISLLSHAKTQVPGVDTKKLLRLIESKYYFPTHNPELLSTASLIIICVPTPLDINGKPNLEYIESASKIIDSNIGENVLVVNESTSFPGTLRQIIQPLIRSKLTTLFAASPERVDPGNKLWTLKNTPRIISGLTEEATTRAESFYKTICDSVIKVSSPEVAEAAKIFENTFRQVNIALANEFSKIAKTLGINANEAIDAAGTKPFGFMPFYPGIGVGGHCIPVDPVYLTYIAEKNDISCDLINIANNLNSNMPTLVANFIKNELGGELKGKSIQLAGISYKTDISDMREAPAINLISLLRSLGAAVTWHDPLVNELNGEISQDLNSEIDLGLIVTPHKAIDFSLWKLKGTRVMDLSTSREFFGWPKYL